MNDLYTDKGRPLTEEENAKIRDLLDKDERVTWIWATLRVWATWVSAIVTAYYAGKAIMFDFINKMIH